MNNKFYITTTLPYVNADPHLGFALEIVQADTIARYHRLLGDDVFFNFGTDEHGLKIYRKALEVKKDPQQYCDEYAAKFDDLKKALNLSYTNFIRTTDPHHLKTAQEFWKLCDKNGYIEKKNYRIKYCVGCELEKTDSELVDGKCPLHPNLEIEVYKEENYFFKFSKFQDKLLTFYKEHSNFVIPEVKFNEIKAFVKRGLEDFSISRLKAKMPWGIDVPGDSKHVMYVWFDALINYLSTLGWPEDLQKFKEFWPGIQVAGKDNLRQQTAIWQAMLMAAGLPNSKQIFIHGFITINGQKISKSLGNSVDPFKLVEKYGTDAVRYYLLREIPSYGDGDFSERRFKELYNADLANGLGNLVARVAKLCEKVSSPIKRTKYQISNNVKKYLDEFRFDEALKEIWIHIDAANQAIDEIKPWRLGTEELEESLEALVSFIDVFVPELEPFLPETAEKIKKQFAGPKIKSEPPLFPRIK
ncbi:MAG: methionine--tRNA ligase [Patescibacteria group bacterium]|nr:methionine--tRNA ligase [Patescibacteria group bacterium]MCL5095236.1 methionine--tRNA ligase [Patescibacteria group bacterium]